MGIHASKLDDTLSTIVDQCDTTLTTETRMVVSPKDIVHWEKIYKERFTRKFIFSIYSRPALFILGDKDTSASSFDWKIRLDPDSWWNHCNPRYRGATPEPLTAELAERTRHELRGIYHRYQLCFSLRHALKLAWMVGFVKIPHVPYLMDAVDVSRLNEIKNGYILPARIRAHILGRSEDVPAGEDPLLTKHLEWLALVFRFDNPSRMPYEDNLLSGSSWLNQTTAIYFEPIFENFEPNHPWVDFTGRGLYAAWREVYRTRGEIPNLQQARYIANPVILLGESEPRPIADVIATHKRICDAVADTQHKPVSPKDPYSWVEHGAEMGVIYPSVILVVDDPRDCRKGRTEAEARDIMFEQFSVLLVRTGNEDHLTEPIDFSELGPATLPLGRVEELHGKQQVVRVRLRTAVRFIMELERREQDRCPRLTAIKRVLDEETFQDAETFASNSLAMAEENGSIDRNFYTWEAVRRARAYLDKEPYYTDPELADDDKPKCALRQWYH